MRGLYAAALAMLAAGLLAACAAPAPRLRVIEPGSYMLTLEAQKVPEGKREARARVTEESERYCAAQGKRAHPTHLTSGVSDYVLGGEVELNFRCDDLDAPPAY